MRHTRGLTEERRRSAACGRVLGPNDAHRPVHREVKPRMISGPNWARRYGPHHRRLCARPGCGAPAAATLRFQPTQREAWLVDLDDEGARTEGDLCARHAAGLVLPRGWQLHNDLAASRPDDAAEVAPPVRRSRVRRGRPGPPPAHHDPAGPAPGPERGRRHRASRARGERNDDARARARARADRDAPPATARRGRHRRGERSARRDARRADAAVAPRVQQRLAPRAGTGAGNRPRDLTRRLRQERQPRGE